MNDLFPQFQSVTSDLSATLPYPHSSSERFAYGKGESLIFDDGEKGEYVNYSDRASWDKEACRRAGEKVKNFPNSQKWETGLYWQTWLEGYHDAPVTLHKIYACTGIDGHPIWCFDYDVNK